MNKLLFISLIAFLAVPAVSQEDEQTTLTKVGQAVPNFTVTTIDGTTLRMSELKGRVVLIDFFATWCGPCMDEMPKIESEIWQGLRDNRLVVLAIGRKHTSEELNKFNDEKGFTFFIGPDPTGEIFSLFATESIPRNYVIDANGNIAYQGLGYSPGSFTHLVAAISSQLK